MVANLQREETATAQYAENKDYAVEMRARIAERDDELQRRPAALHAAIANAGAAEFVAQAAEALEDMKLAQLHDVIDAKIFGGLADASEQMTAIDLRFEDAVQALAGSKYHSASADAAACDIDRDRLLLQLTAPQLAAEASSIATTSVLNFVDEAYGQIVDASAQSGSVSQLAILELTAPAVDEVITAQSTGASTARIDIATLSSVRLKLAKAMLELQLLERTAEDFRKKAADADPSLSQTLFSSPIRHLRKWIDMHLESNVSTGVPQGRAVLNELRDTLDRLEAVANERIPLLQADVANVHADIGAKVRLGTATKLVASLERRAERYVPASVPRARGVGVTAASQSLALPHPLTHSLSCQFL